MIDKLEKLKIEYRDECVKLKECDTYRGFLGWLENRGVKISYFDGMELGLLDFNNSIFYEVESVRNDNNR